MAPNAHYLVRLANATITVTQATTGTAVASPRGILRFQR
jgi:hypothetical protein